MRPILDMESGIGLAAFLSMASRSGPGWVFGLLLDSFAQAESPS